ncbi:hypothetical protein H6P81_018877 [Aristolochia fimbriata]|uniref:Uncharacterized protein n=1 Tax=Aristolochia fimbriata TaxID=158543 RepID=A0AAV7E370_ARIFI|nr:hypothetical protein H6P81_018877 [Aristolochia fimbriata]
MEKAREMRRNGTRFPPGKRLPKASSGHKLISALNGGDVDFSERPKREKLRASGHLVRPASSNEDSEMGGGSEGEEDLRPPSSSRRVKLNSKAFDECNAVDPASVPRKLRSAMSKRNRESISPPLPDAKKHHASNGADWSVINGARKSKQTLAGSVDKSPKRAPRSAISKDEEEVVEALYALACISPCDKPCKSKGDRKPIMGKTAALPEMRACSLPPQEASKEEKKEKEEIEKLPDSSVVTVTGNLASSRDESLDNTAKVEPEKEPNPTVAEQPIALVREKLDVEKRPGAQNDIQAISLLPKDECKENPQLNDCVNFLNPMGISSDSHTGNRLLNTLPAEEPAVNKTNNEAWAAITASKSQAEGQPAKENCESGTQFPTAEGPELWPGMPSVSSDSQCLSNRLIGAKSSAVWPDSANHANRTVSSGNDVLMAKLPPVLADKRPSWKRSETHVYISRLIRGYQGSEKKNDWALPLSAKQSKPIDGAKQAVSESIAELPSLKIGTSSIVSSGTNTLAAEKNMQEARGDIHQDNRLLQDQQASATSSGLVGQQKQRCDFLSLLPGCGTGLEPSRQSQVSYLQSLVQHQSHHPVMPFSLPHARYSSPYPDQIAAAAATVQQLPQYVPNLHPYNPHLVQSSTISKEQQQQQHQQQQQNQLWAAQLAQYRSSNIASHDFSKWPNGRQESSPVIPTTTSSSMMDGLGGLKYQTTNQQFFANIGMPPSRGQRPLHSGSFEDGVGFRSDAPPPHLQLLCNAQHM